MIFQLFVFGVFLLITSVMSIATCAIAIQCYNKCENPNMNAEHPQNKTFLIINLMLSIGMVFASIYICKNAISMTSMMGGMGMGGMGMGGMGMGGMSRLFT
jgi:hypothetical protein